MIIVMISLRTRQAPVDLCCVDTRANAFRRRKLNYGALVRNKEDGKPSTRIENNNILPSLLVRRIPGIDREREIEIDKETREALLFAVETTSAGEQY